MLLNVKKTLKSVVTKVLVLPTLFKSSIGIGIDNTFCHSIVIGTNNSFTSIDGSVHEFYKHC